MEAVIKVQVRARAGDRCEYCRIHQHHYLITFHIEHIVARQHGGSDNATNLALACHFCNRQKGPNLAGLDPDTGRLTRLFHPRTDVWSAHFQSHAGRRLGRTPVGRTTVRVLNMNQPDRVRLRVELEPEIFGV
jgi:5-methylcytosine-specific restriction endonuclease McrA